MDIYIFMCSYAPLVRFSLKLVSRSAAPRFFSGADNCRVSRTTRLSSEVPSARGKSFTRNFSQPRGFTLVVGNNFIYSRRYTDIYAASHGLGTYASVLKLRVSRDEIYAPLPRRRELHVLRVRWPSFKAQFRDTMFRLTFIELLQSNNQLKRRYS